MAITISAIMQGSLSAASLAQYLELCYCCGQCPTQLFQPAVTGYR